MTSFASIHDFFFQLKDPNTNRMTVAVNKNFTKFHHLQKRNETNKQNAISQQQKEKKNNQMFESKVIQCVVVRIDVFLSIFLFSFVCVSENWI